MTPRRADGFCQRAKDALPSRICTLLASWQAQTRRHQTAARTWVTPLYRSFYGRYHRTDAGSVADNADVARQGGASTRTKRAYAHFARCAFKARA